MTSVEHSHRADVLSVNIGVFEGPLELLIELIEKRKLLISDVSLAAVTDEYMERVAKMEQNPLRETAQFVVLASTLLLIKSKSLLPVLELTNEEEGAIDDLEERLKLYQIYRNAGKMLQGVFSINILYGKDFAPNSEPLFITDKYTKKDVLADVMKEILVRLPKKIERPGVAVKKTVTLEEMMERLIARIEKQMKFKFNDFAGKGNEKERGTVIVGFLAVLEMVKQGKVLVRQTGRFDDIEIEREGNDVPRYM